MTKEDIKKAATEYANEACRPLQRTGNEQVCMVDFMEGAKWRISNAWHDTSEEPTEKRKLVVIDVTGEISESNFMPEFESWQEYVKEAEIEKWCYKEDLIPNTEE